MRGFKRLHGTYFSLSFGTIAGRLTPGAACVVSTKTARQAVKRNLIKRRCRNALLPLLLKIKTPIVLVWLAKATVSKASFKEIQAEVETLSRKVGVM